MRTDTRRSEISTYLNFLYKGATVYKEPWYYITSGHHTSGEWPNKSGSTYLLILHTKSLAKRGYFTKLSKKRTQFF